MRVEVIAKSVVQIGTRTYHPGAKFLVEQRELVQLGDTVRVVGTNTDIPRRDRALHTEGMKRG